MIEKIKQSVDTIRKDGFRVYFFVMKEYLKRVFLFTPVFRSIGYKVKRKISSSPYFEQEVQGSKMILDLRDNGICRELFINKGLREPECTRLFAGELAEGMVVVDIGANIGYYLLQEAQIVGKGGKIYGIEPEPRSFKMLTRNIAANNHAAPIETYQIAIADKIGTAPFYITEHWNRNSLHELKGFQKSQIIEKIDVETTTLDAFMQDKRPPDVIRMDVEGFEYQIIKGMKNILAQPRPLKIYMEVHPQLIEEGGGSVEGMLSTLDENGFFVTYVVRDELNFHLPALKRAFRKGPIALSETAYEYRKPIGELLHNEQARRKLIGDRSYCYGLFLEKYAR